MNTVSRTKSNPKRSILTSFKEVFKPNAVNSLFFFAVILVILAIFVFGPKGRHPNADWEDVIRSVGIAVLAAMVTSIIDRQYFLGHIEERISIDFREAAGVAKSLTELGIYTSHDHFDFSTIFREANKGETVSWLDTYCPLQNAFLKALEAASARGVNVRMLIIDPKSETSMFRNEELASSSETGMAYETGLQGFILRMTAIAERSGGTFEIRFYCDLPCIPMYLVGDAPYARKGYFSLFLTKPTAECQHLEVHSGEWLTDMAKYFQEKWDRQKSIPATPPRRAN
ncbi:hypothetical protein [Mycobacterium sp. 050134]|uniref:hypothetical protein n=1 Tax=Mycobacterium sp. 050134 TaxID=3096111 RepID=UPI002ED7D45D